MLVSTGNPRFDPVLALGDRAGANAAIRRPAEIWGRVSRAESPRRVVTPPALHTIKTRPGPGRFSPIPAMSMVSAYRGSRFVELIGGVMTSFCRLGTPAGGFAAGVRH